MIPVRNLLLVMVFCSSLASAQGLFWVVDSDDQFIGEVAGVDPVHAWVAIPAPDGEPVFAPVAAVGGDPSGHATLLFESASCSGLAYVETTNNAPALRVGHFVTDNWLWATKRSSLVAISAQSMRGDDLQCVGTAPTFHFAREVEELGNLAFTPPLRVIRNPNVLLLDGFELGNTSHWQGN